MTEKANPSISRPAEAFKTAGAIAYGGHGGDGFVVASSSPTDISVQDGGISESGLNAFAETSSASSFDVTIDGGEAFIFGSWVAIDTDTVVTLASSTAGQTVYAGWNKNGSDDVIVGLASAFSTASGDTDEKIPLWTFDTDGSGVTNVVDERSIGYTQESTTFTGDVDISGNSITDGASLIYDGANGFVEQDSLENDSLTIAGNGVSLGGSTGINYTELSDTGTSFPIPNTDLSNNSITVSSGTNITGGGTVSLGGTTTIDHADTSTQGDISSAAGAAVTDITLDDQGHTTSIGTTDFDSRFVLESGDTMSGGLTIGGDLTATNGETIWDESATYIPQARLQNDSVTINSGTDLTGGGGVSLGGSVTIDHADTSNQGDVTTGGATVIDDIYVDGNGHVDSLNTENRSLSDWTVPFDFNINSASRFGLPQRSSDPSASAGDIWYRTDLD